MYEGALCAVKAGEEVVPATELKALRQRIRESNRLLGRKTMEVEILKEKPLPWLVEKTAVAKALSQGGRYLVKTITERLGVCRSNQYEQRRRDRRHLQQRYNKAEDEWYLSLICKNTDERPT
jgi:hypothetical protein